MCVGFHIFKFTIHCPSLFSALPPTVAVWLVRDCGLLSCQVTAKFGAGCYAPKTTETLINYTAWCALHEQRTPTSKLYK